MDGMFNLCLFDLDNTLVRTEDLEQIRLDGKNDQSADYKKKLKGEYASREDRNIYEPHILEEIREKYPKLKFGVFTRSPKSYASTVLKLAYPGFDWDVVVAYEDVNRTKPYGDGIHVAMDKLGLKNLSKVAMVGDQDSDVRAAYNAGVAVVLDTTSWGSSRNYDNWNALNHIPDAVIGGPSELLKVLDNLPKFQPFLEKLMAEDKETTEPRRFDKIGKFIPRQIGGDNTAYQIFTAGRSFANYESLSERKKWHLLTASIHDNKDADTFPEEWVESIYFFIRKTYPFLMFGGNLVVSVVPHRPGRKPRLENLLTQLSSYISSNAFSGSNRISFEPELLAYKEGVRSNSNDHLKANERFANVRDHLFVNKPEVAQGKKVLVIDDVCTTGSSLIYAGLYLSEAGSGEVTRLAISMNVGNVLNG
jgi:HAD superfamily hydrolase (TIGR01509 family)